MQTKDKSAIIIVAAVLVGAFFMPWIKAFANINAWDMVFGEVGQMMETPFRFIAVIIPLSGILIIRGAAFNKEKYPI